jgi:hypothetical protein
MLHLLHINLTDYLSRNNPILYERLKRIKEALQLNGGKGI